MGKLSRPANANNNNSGIGKYDNHISDCAHKIFITGGMEGKRENSRRKEREREILPAWRRRIFDLSLGGRRRHLIVAEHGHLESSQEKSSCGWMSEKFPKNSKRN